MFKPRHFIAIAVIAFFSTASPVWADPEDDKDDKDEKKKPDTGWLAPVKADIYKGDYASALGKLKKANDAKSADWNNLMGFALRKNSPPDLPRAEKHYQSALAIKPDHKGALEYYGELKLMQKDLAGAQALQSKLSSACPSGCEQLDDLNAAIKKYQESQ